MGMARSGTTLLAEMIHKAGTPMFACDGETDPSYDGGIRYERRSTRDLNTAIFGLENNAEVISVVGLPLHPLPADALQRLADEVQDKPWGFKNPRTTLTYSVWCQAFPRGPRFYTYRHHEEVMRHYLVDPARSWISRIKRARRAVFTWMCCNDQLLRNIEMDRQADRPAVLVRYEELMQDDLLIPRVEQATGIRLFDARDWSLRRNIAQQERGKCLSHLLSGGYQRRIARIYRELDRLCLHAGKDTRSSAL